MTESNKRKTGAYYEALAADHLTGHGARIVTKNFRNRNGEIDIVAFDGEYLVFIEVKFRTSERSGSGAEAVGFRKQYRICRVADFYLTRFGFSESTPVRFDVVECASDERNEIRVTWYRNAFPYHPRRSGY